MTRTDHQYRLGGGTSERQWRDVMSIVLVQGSRLDRQYLSTVAERSASPTFCSGPTAR
ncbi:MAG TPA: hypothetical protein VFO84_00665 [Dehalococcoidia bacterium]|nr:hypothetical protein [Dehalococcoidia bacterium]